jgi:hypothetical protein
MTTQLLVHLPTELAARFRLAVPARSRSSYVSKLLEQHLPNSDDALYQAAVQAQAFDDAHPEDTATFDVALQDGLDASETFDMAKLKALCQQ